MSNMLNEKGILEERGQITKSEFERSIDSGVSSDGIDMRTLAKWSTLLVIFLTGLILLGMNLYTTYSYEIEMETAINTKYSELKNLQQKANTQLNSYGVVDQENNIYHIPIDKAIETVSENYKK